MDLDVTKVLTPHSSNSPTEKIRYLNVRQPIPEILRRENGDPDSRPTIGMSLIKGKCPKNGHGMRNFAG